MVPGGLQDGSSRKIRRGVVKGENRHQGSRIADPRPIGTKHIEWLRRAEFVGSPGMRSPRAVERVGRRALGGTAQPLDDARTTCSATAIRHDLGVAV